jgi:alpha-L-rhamnosidase
MRRLITEIPYKGNSHDRNLAPWEITEQWPAWWVACADAGQPPFTTAYRCFFKLDNPEMIRVHVSADERYELFLDGVRIGRGSERGDLYNWYFETYDLELGTGEHTLVARVWTLGAMKSCGQVSLYPGFILSPQEEKYLSLLGTGTAAWEVKKLEGYEFVDSFPKGVGTGARFILDGEHFPWGFEKGEGEGWKPVVNLNRGYGKSSSNIVSGVHVMRPAVLPPMLEQKITRGRCRHFEHLQTANTRDIEAKSIHNIPSRAETWSRVLKGEPVTIPPHSICRGIFDLEEYYCAYPEVYTSGGKGSKIQVNWSETLCDRELQGNRKYNRNDLEGKYFEGIGDVFQPDGGTNRKFDTLWWHAGRYVEVIVETSGEALTIEGIKILETRYPLELESTFTCADERINRTIPGLFRSLQMCCHETYMDCPYWEQLMYVGDTRLQVLINYTSTHDDTMPRKALDILEASRYNPTRLIKCSYPEHGGKIIPSFCLWWVGMLYDYALWRDDQTFVKTLLPGMRDTIDLVVIRNELGLIENPEGWNFMDWSGNVQNPWRFGIPPVSSRCISSIFNWQAVLVLNMAAEVELYAGEVENAERYRRMASELAAATTLHFWNENKGIFADDLEHRYYSEHAQCLAVLSGFLDDDKKMSIANVLTTENQLAKTTIYFSHYLFEAFRELNRMDALMEQLKPWLEMEDNGLKTTPEMFTSDTRSDCHAWGAHPLYHYFATILGIRPGSMGFETVHIRPQLGGLKSATGRMVHPKGWIEVDFMVKNGLQGTIELPDGVAGVLEFGGKTLHLCSGIQTIG